MKLHKGLMLLSIKKKKLAIQRTALFKIIEVVGSRALWLDLPNNLKINNVISKTYLVLVRAPSEDPYKQTTQPLPLDIINREFEYKVEWILFDWLVRGKRKYLVCYKGYRPKDDYEYDSKGLEHCQELLNKYCSQTHCNNLATS